ncbi:PREDICTED: uncharacterized protein LOC104766295 [Camelina sativa]|uniref:Uncharacterized protein LOC104766295 n=1 Tax=Camelina sativa TaxID=90675 RepID=A0ABM0XNA5_CAMSA|nr:PREDICTED: uncharacterized protein LOC104766295 [Camelina sativa]
MAEPNQIPRKRMRFSSPSATEILATKKSQNHQRLASQTVNRSRVHHPSPSLPGKIDRTYPPRVTIKDLRLRRVFSPNPTDDCEFNGKGRNRNKEEQYHICRCNCPDSNNGIKAHACGLGNVEAGELIQTTPAGSELVNEEINVAASVKRSVTTNLGSNKSVLHPCSIAKIFKDPNSLSYKRLLPYLMQVVDDGTSSTRCSKPLSQNPPDISLSCNREAGETGEDVEEEVSELMTPKCQLPETTKPVSQSVDTVLVKDSAGSLFRNTSPLKRVIASSPNKKAACSRRKLFKTPGSVNYRRMLPYLRDVQENNPCVPETVDHPDQQKNTEENTPSSTLVSENEGVQEMVTSNAAGESDTSSNENEESIPCEHLSVSPEQSDIDKEQETQVKHVIPDTEKNSETPLGSEIPLSSPLVGSRSSSEVASSALPKTFVNNLVGGENMNGAGETEAKISAEQLTAELLDSSAVLATPPSVSPSKGILRRSMRGCRGSCSCLNCSSFRLNAERAFEFSRNQLQDTEVMVLDLVGEISRLRDMLEKSADQNDYKSQAGEASKRAGEAAELAKSRLHQMNDDLQVHCRIPNEQRARVNFAHYIHEKTIVKASQPNNLITRSP